MDRIHTYLYRLTCYLAAALFLCGGLSACSDKEEPQISGEEAQISLILKTGKYNTRATATDESIIHSLYAIVFEKDQSGIYQYVYMTAPGRAENTNQFNIRLYTTPNSLKILLLGNIENVGSYLHEAITEAEIRQALLTGFDGTPMDYLPMYGELIFENGISEEGTATREVSMLRSVAGVEISLTDELYQKNEFELKSIQAYRANSLIQVIPEPAALDPQEWKANSTSIPATAENRITTSFVNATGIVQSLERIYLPESEAKTNATSEATCLIIGGIYKGQGYETNTTITYYRVDFKEELSTGQILRNHLYDIAIEEVKGNGTTHPDENLNTGDGLIKTRITVWNEITGDYNEGGSGGNYFGISTTHATLSWFKGATKSIQVNSSKDFTISFENGTRYGKSETVRTHHFDIVHMQDSLYITTKADNGHTAVTEEIQLHIDGISDPVNIKITQLANTMFIKEYISVFSFQGTLGNLGDNTLTTGDTDHSTAFTLQNFFLNSEFQPGSRVPIGGFAFSYLNYVSGFTHKKAEMYEVIVSPGGPTMTDEDRELLVNDWLPGKNNRVLLTYITNDRMMSALGKNAEQLPATGNISYDVSAKTPDFIQKGPFGDISHLIGTLSAPVEAVAGVWGLEESNNPDITPILVYEGGGHNFIVVGIDLQRRIIYLGDPYLFGATSNRTNTDFFSPTGELRPNNGSYPGIDYMPPDILLCNIINWIAETVVGEKLAADK